ncbi:MAG: family 10 glycosylhydrolase [Bacteroidales bacterium]|nr:family 10 glycosylhydrolase [Bacteroidales bacterium]
MKKSLFFALSLLFVINIQAAKREFRGVWIHTVQQSQYKTMNAGEMQAYFIDMLDQFQQCGINALIFQVRPQADAFYKSDLEPWSRFLTGEQGLAPATNWDPMAFLIQECHKRNMEFHAWLNPYRVTSNENEKLSENHIYWKHPEWFVKYGKQIYFDPGVPECRRFIEKVVKDIVTRYDVDAIHMDDYFYPYPIAGEEFPDKESFNNYALGQGFSSNQKADWRRNNVNLLINELKETIYTTKPWVRLGISPFGIYRNKSKTPDGSGSETNGLQNYDELYADVVLWSKKSWIDYVMPQLYWEIGHKAADYTTLVKWWSEHTNTDHLYIGQSVVRSMQAIDVKTGSKNQLTTKLKQAAASNKIQGNCWWNGYDILRNEGGIKDSLRNNYYRYPALVPAYTNMDGFPPLVLKKLWAEWTPNGYFLFWQPKQDKDSLNVPNRFCIYRFKSGEKYDLNNPANIIKITTETSYQLPYDKGNVKYTYAVTALDRYNYESKKAKKKSVKL